MNTYVDKRTHLCYNLSGDMMRNTNKQLLFCSLNCFGSLLLGLLIYVFLRNNTWLHKIFSLTSPILLHSSPFINFLRYYFVDALWAYALTMALTLPIGERWAAGAAAGFGLFWEVMQGLNWVSGTADVADVLMYLSASVLAALINTHFKRRLL